MLPEGLRSTRRLLWLMKQQLLTLMKYTLPLKENTRHIRGTSQYLLWHEWINRSVLEGYKTGWLFLYNMTCFIIHYSSLVNLILQKSLTKSHVPRLQRRQLPKNQAEDMLFNEVSHQIANSSNLSHVSAVDRFTPDKPRPHVPSIHTVTLYLMLLIPFVFESHWWLFGSGFIEP